jgi:PIN domain nuclease of toxin-antitoxin system
MEYLIDTHVLVWYLDGNPALSKNLVEQLENAERITVSIASLWELTIKSDLGKITLSSSLQQIHQNITEDNRYKLLGISFGHLKALSGLPKHHNDPFDRLLIAQAITENLPIMSVDRHVKEYPVVVIC